MKEESNTQNTDAAKLASTMATCSLEGLRQKLLDTTLLRRDVDGYVSNSAVPRMDEDADFGKLAAAVGLDCAVVRMEMDAPDLYERYVEGASTEVAAAWSPDPPDEGFVLCYTTDNEDGPVALFVRPAKPAHSNARADALTSPRSVHGCDTNEPSNAVDAKRWRCIAELFDRAGTSESRRILDDLGVQGSPLLPLGRLIDEHMRSEGASRQMGGFDLGIAAGYEGPPVAFAEVLNSVADHRVLIAISTKLLIGARLALAVIDPLLHLDQHPNRAKLERIRLVIEDALLSASGDVMNEWNVYVDGRYVGTVDARNEESARLAAWSTFDPPEDAEISVSKR